MYNIISAYYELAGKQPLPMKVVPYYCTLIIMVFFEVDCHFIFMSERLLERHWYCCILYNDICTKCHHFLWHLIAKSFVWNLQEMRYPCTVNTVKLAVRSMCMNSHCESIIMSNWNSGFRILVRLL